MNLVDRLNPAQKEAVTAATDPVLVLAGPGSGKTRVLTHRIAYLIQEMHVAPWHILAVTFTNKAAREMRERVERILGDNLRGLQMGTFHSTCARLLRRESEQLEVLGYTPEFVIFDSDDQLQIVKRVLKELNLDDKKFQPRGLLGRISRAKEKLITPTMYMADDYMGSVTKRVYELYQAELIANNAMDFDDLLHNTVRLFDDVPDVLERYRQRFQHILVDEFQDTNGVQYALITRLAAEHRSIFIVGDSDQSIYKWRGADFQNLQKFRNQFDPVKQVLLEQNYRSTQLILDAAKAVIKRNRDRVHKELFTERKGGRQINQREAYNETEEADFIVNEIARGVLSGREPGDYAIMYRTNAQSRVLEEAFIRKGLPYRLVGATRFYARKEIKDILAYLRLIHNPKDEVSFRRAVNTPKRGIGNTTQAKLLEWGAKYELQAGESVMLLAGDSSLDHSFNGRAMNALTRFGNLLSGWITIRDHVSVGDLVNKVIEQSDFKGYLNDGTEEGQNRWANVLEFKGVAESESEGKLADFLEQVALVSDVDGLEIGTNAPTLLTLHASKGLEFPTVFIVGVEDGILPHSRTFDSVEELEEERRLFYVGMTRARDELYLLHAFRRSLYGMSDVAVPSRFLTEIPAHLVATDGKSQSAAKSRMSSWNDQIRHAGSRSTRQRSSTSSSSSHSRRSNSSRSSTISTSTTAKPVIPAKKLRKPYSEQQTESHEPIVAKHKTGQTVRHKKFGEGTVIESKLTGNDEEVIVAFPDIGIKKLVASFANLEII